MIRALVQQRIRVLRIEPVRARRPGLRAGASPLAVHYTSTREPISAAVEERLLASIDYGVTSLPALPAPIRVSVPLPQLGGQAFRETWAAGDPVELARHSRVTLARSGPVAFGFVETPGGAGPELEEATREIYDEILAALSGSGHPHPLRFWNVFPRINEPDRDLERYRWFCRGRAEAFESRYGPDFERVLCSASAVGSADGPLLVYFLASSEPGTHLENPRQVSAFDYPPEYGPRSPSFARATRCPTACGGSLLLSGTASIVGHRTLHRGNVVEQLRETLRNLDRLAEGRPYRHLKVFVRRARDLAAVRNELERHLDPHTAVLYLQADICRPDLLLEIEGVAG